MMDRPSGEVRMTGETETRDIGQTAGAAPWTEDEVARLVERQADSSKHPYTCADHPDVRLVPLLEGWWCPRLEHQIVQRWAHEEDLVGDD